ncbi:MAG TPA: copper chaperone PCu(A)C [Porticoccaceae bacterium]|jgi:copper(I)-binding protein|nr:copper chaperone PCu(A)C [Porticoccaceae bacterium]
MKKLLILVLLFATPALAQAAAPTADVQVTNAYIRTMPPGRTTTAGFLTIANNSDQSCELTGAMSTLSNRLEFHEHQHTQGMMKMRPVATVVVPAGETVVFEPGGLHIMLFNIDTELAAGEVTQMQLITDQCGSISFDAKVRSLLAKPKKMEGMHH